MVVLSKCFGQVEVENAPQTNLMESAKDVWYHTTTNSSLQVTIEQSAWEEECDNSKYGEKHAEDKAPAKKLLH